MSSTPVILHGLIITQWRATIYLSGLENYHQFPWMTDVGLYSRYELGAWAGGQAIQPVAISTFFGQTHNFHRPRESVGGVTVIQSLWHSLLPD
jgi:hypothetical protein